jgi:subtilase family serine protease
MRTRLTGAVAGLTGAVTGLAAIAMSVGSAGAPAAATPAGHGARIQPLSHLATDPSGNYTPAQIRTAYNLRTAYRHGIDGSGTTIGIVDVYGSPDLRGDLAAFDHHFNLPAPPSLRIVAPAGPLPTYDPSNQDMYNWALETTLDVEWAHAIAPGARIVLALTPVDEIEGTSGFAQIVTAERYLVDTAHVDVISQSFAATEETFPSRASLVDLRSAFVDARRRGVPMLAASGDLGASGAKTNVTYAYDRRVLAWPASDPLVTAVGGTQISLDSAGRATAPPRAWGSGPSISQMGGGGGVSEFFRRPAFQSSVAGIVGSARGAPDISMDASCDPPVAIFLSSPGQPPGEQSTCGTSLASPLFAGVVALATQLHGGRLGYLNPLLYRLGARHAPGIVDVTHGNNSVQLPSGRVVTGYKATAGYDLATGWGTVEAANIIPELARKPRL